MQYLRRIIADRLGATSIEYGLIGTLIAIAGITAMGGLGTKISTMFNNVTSGINVF